MLGDRARVIEVLKIVDVVRACAARSGRGIRAAAGCDQQRIERIFAAACEHGAAFRIDRIDARLQLEIDARRFMIGEVAHHDLLFRQLLAQHRRKRDAIVERVGLVAEEGDLARRIVLAQLLGGRRSGKPITHDDVASRIGKRHTSPIMDVRLVQLLGSFITARSEYALARLECSMRDPELPSAPIIDRLSEASERALRDEWPTAERQLETALTFGKHLSRSLGTRWQSEAAYRNLDRVLRELDQYARAIRWVLTVTESEDTT